MMIEQKKAARVMVLGIQMDAYRVDRALHLTSHYLERNKLEYVAFVNTATALWGQGNEDFVHFTEQAVMVLPGDNNIEDAVGERHWIEGETSYQTEYFRCFLSRLNRQRAAVYLMMEREEDLERLKGIFASRYEKIQLESILWQNDEGVDSMVNEINILAPEVLLICGDYERICSFVKEHGNKINAGICFTMNALSADGKVDYPEWVKALHLEGLYIWLYKKPATFIYDAIFKRRMKQHSREQMEESGDAKKNDENICNSSDGQV